MEVKEFIEHFTAQFDDAPEAITEDSVFRDINGWSSLVALSVIAMADEEYDVTLTGNDIRDSVTVKDIFEKIKSIKN